MTVNYAVTGGTAVSGTNFTPLSGTLTFNPGELSKVITLSSLYDGVIGASKTVTVTLSSPAGANIGAISSSTWTITDHDPAISLDWTPPTITVQHPADGAFINTNPAITGVVSDDSSGVVSFSSVDVGALTDVTFDPVTGAFSFTTGLTLAGHVSDGAHTVQFQATDLAGTSRRPRCFISRWTRIPPTTPTVTLPAGTEDLGRSPPAGPRSRWWARPIPGRR